MKAYPFYFFGHGLGFRLKHFDFFCWFLNTIAKEERLEIQKFLESNWAFARYFDFAWCRNILQISFRESSYDMSYLVDKLISNPIDVLTKCNHDQLPFSDRTMDLREMSAESLKLLSFNYELDRIILRLQQQFPVFLSIYSQTRITKFSPWHYYSMQEVLPVLDHFQDFFLQNKEERTCKQPVWAFNKILYYLTNDVLFKLMPLENKELIYNKTLTALGYDYDIDQKYSFLLQKLNSKVKDQLIRSADYLI
jgi:hypothetical protein